MNTYVKHLAFSLLVLVALLPAACSLEAGTEAPATATATTTVEDTATPEPTATPTVVDEPTATPTTQDPTVTPTAVETTPTATSVPATETPTVETPVAVIRSATNVRVGPGLNYPVSHVLPGGVEAQLVGRNADGGWWAVPGPGDGPGPNGWIAGWVVTVRGDTSGLPILPAPPTVTPTPSPTATSVPIVQDPGAPPTNACVAINPNEANPIDVHLGPGQQFALVARLGNWAEVLKSENGWHQIVIGPGQTGWVDGGMVDLTGPCDDAPPKVSVYPIVDGDTGFLLGSWHDDFGWVHAAATANQLGERRYRLFAGSTDVGSVQGSAPTASEGVCNQPAVTLSPAPPAAGTIGVTGGWNQAPRIPQPTVDGVEPKEIVAELLRQRGLTDPDVRITESWQVDLEGDGSNELVIAASRFAAGSQLPSVSAGDYSVVIVQKTVGGNSVIVPVVFDVYLQDEDLRYPMQHSIAAMLDLNGDGQLELLVRGDRYEGRTLTVYEIVNGRAEPALDAGCLL